MRCVLVVVLAAGLAGVSAGASLAQGRIDPVRIEDRLNALERQIANLTGQVEQLQFKLQQQQQQMERMQADYEFRLNQLEGGKGGGQRPPAAGQAPAPRPPAAPPPSAGMPPSSPLPPVASAPPSGMSSPGGSGVLAPPPGSGSAGAMGGAQGADQLYEIGFNQMQEKDFVSAEGTFRNFLQSYPRHALAGNAQFWIGEIYFTRKDYVNASIAYAEGYRSYPKSPKGADNLLQLGRSLALTNQVKEACTIWDRLGREYPNAGELIRMRAAQERQRYRCA